VIERSERSERSEFRCTPRECIGPGSRSAAKADASAATDQAALGFAALSHQRTNDSK
jgi:hypothetical protein